MCGCFICIVLPQNCYISDYFYTSALQLNFVWSCMQGANHSLYGVWYYHVITREYSESTNLRQRLCIISHC